MLEWNLKFRNSMKFCTGIHSDSKQHIKVNEDSKQYCRVDSSGSLKSMFIAGILIERDAAVWARLPVRVWPVWLQVLQYCSKLDLHDFYIVTHCWILWRWSIEFGMSHQVDLLAWFQVFVCIVSAMANSLRAVVSYCMHCKVCMDLNHGICASSTDCLLTYIRYAAFSLNVSLSYTTSLMLLAHARPHYTIISLINAQISLVLCLPFSFLLVLPVMERRLPLNMWIHSHSATKTVVLLSDLVKLLTTHMPLPNCGSMRGTPLKTQNSRGQTAHIKPRLVPRPLFLIFGFAFSRSIIHGSLGFCPLRLQTKEQKTGHPRKKATTNLPLTTFNNKRHTICIQTSNLGICSF